jgi:hypothetical protein
MDVALMEPAHISVKSGADFIVNKCELRRGKPGDCEMNIYISIRKRISKNANEIFIRKEFIWREA